MDKNPFMTIQPYLVLDLGNFCQHVLFENGISHFFSFSNRSREDVAVPLLADGCRNIIFEYRDGTLRTHFIGSLAERRSFSVKGGAEYFGVRLVPGSSFCIPDLSSKEAVGKVFILDGLDFARSLCGRMGAQEGFDARVRTFLAGYQPLCTGQDRKAAARQELFRQLAAIIVRRRGLLKVSQLEQLSGYTSRYINQIFESELGFSAKRMCSTVKLQFLLHDMNRGKEVSLTELSSAYEFYDQSHFIHEFKEFAGTTPSQYAKAIVEKDYCGNVRSV